MVAVNCDEAQQASAVGNRGTLLYWTHSSPFLFYYGEQTFEVKNSITNSHDLASVSALQPLCQSILNQPQILHFCL